MATIAVATLVLFGSMMLYTRARPFGAPPHCPTCEHPLTLLPQPRSDERHTYDVLVCTECAAVTTRVLGARSGFAWCPDCRQRTLETTPHKLPPTPALPIAVEVEEVCHVCGFKHTRHLPEEGEDADLRPLPENVLPYRRR